MNRTYEVMFIVRPDMVEEDLNKLISTLDSTVTSAGGTTKTEVWGKRRLAYKVAKFNDGIFVLMMIEGAGALVHEVERRLRAGWNLLKQFNPILPVQSLPKKYFCFRSTQITSLIHAVSSHLRGGSRSSRTRGGMQWTRMAL